MMRAWSNPTVQTGTRAGCAAIAAGRRTSRSKSTTRASTGWTRRPGARRGRRRTAGVCRPVPRLHARPAAPRLQRREVEPTGDRWERMVAGTPWVASCTVTVDSDEVETCSGPEAGRLAFVRRIRRARRARVLHPRALPQARRTIRSSCTSSSSCTPARRRGHGGAGGRRARHPRDHLARRGVEASSRSRRPSRVRSLPTPTGAATEAWPAGCREPGWLTESLRPDDGHRSAGLG